MTRAEISALSLPEQWIVTRCHQVINKCTQQLDSCNFGEAGRAAFEFVWDDFADWFIEVDTCTHIHTDVALAIDTSFSKYLDLPLIEV